MRLIPTLLALLVTASAAHARPAQCYVRIDGLLVIDGPCDFAAFGGDGSFQVTKPDGGYFAQVNMIRRGVADGYWNAKRWSGHAHAPLGTLARHDACWSNDLAQICAW